MDEKDIAQIKDILLQKKNRLEKHLSSFASQDPRANGDWDSKYPRTPEGNEEEAADEVEEYSTRLTVEESLETSLRDVNAALEKISRGTFGKCENCENEIEKERLFALPEARTCLKCANSR